MKSIRLTVLPFLLFAFILVARADDATPVAKAPPAAAAMDQDWSIEIGSGFLVADVRTDLPGYTMVPADLTAAMRIDDDSLDNFLDGIVRGHTEFLFRGFGYGVIHGIESRFTGVNFGPRYNFVQPGWKWVPFVEGFVGLAFSDSQGLTITRGQVGQGQDFAFNFGIALGTRYDINDAWFVRFTGVYSHVSNAGLSDPERKNRAMDAAGPEVSLGYRF